MCNKHASDYYLKLGKCHQCDEPISEPVELPCGHKACFNCVVELKMTGIFSCPVQECGKAFLEDMPLVPMPAKKLEIIAHNTFKRQCNSFFMDVVLMLSFCGNIPPEGEVIKKLLNYVTSEHQIKQREGTKRTVTKQPTVFDDSIDRTPVLRSFLLKLLLRSNMDTVRMYFDEFLKRTCEIQSDPLWIGELCLLCFQCFEDNYRCQLTKYDAIVDQISYVNQLLNESITFLSQDFDSLDFCKLEAIAKARFVLSQAVHWMHHFEIEKEHDQIPSKKIRPFLRDVAKLCEDCDLKWTRLFVMKQISRKFGMDEMLELAKIQYLYWIVTPDIKPDEIDEMSDRYVCCGDEYKDIRDVLTRVLLGEEIVDLKEFFQSISLSEVGKDHSLMLALYREITMAYIHKDVNRRPSAEAVQMLMEFIQTCDFVKDKTLARLLLENSLTDELRATTDRTIKHLSMSEIIVHFKIVMSVVRGQGLHRPFMMLILEPSEMQDALLPTMPQDNRDEIRQAIVEGQSQFKKVENAQFYTCPEGHPYVIGDCGNPDSVRDCPACGRSIGGQGHQLVVGNKKLEVWTDMTQSGHILGAAQLNFTPGPERALSPAQLTILRLLLHISMFLGQQDNPEEIGTLIQPQVFDVNSFLRKHINADLQAIGLTLNKSRDDVMLLLHLIMDRMITTNTDEHSDEIPNTEAVLTSKAARHEWEVAYSREYIIPILNGLDQHLGIAQTQLEQDASRLGNNRLLQLLYEVDTTNDIDLKHIENLSTVWRYRADISIEDISHQLYNNTSGNVALEGMANNVEQYPVLKLFLKEEHHLRWLRLLPNITKLHRLLGQQLGRRIDKAEAMKIRIGSREFEDMFQESQSHVKDEVTSLINDFAACWNSVRHSLPAFTFASGKRLDQDYCSTAIDNSTPVGMLLPSDRGLGLCSVALVAYLCQIQNDFMEEYSRITHQSLETSVSVQDASHLQLISYHPDQDLIQALLANCNYSLEANKGTTIEYDLATLERQIEERFIRGRPRLNVDKIEHLIFREESTTISMYTQLQRIIPQELIPANVQREVEDEMKGKLTDINESLVNLDTAVGYLASVGEDPDASLQEFMTKVLKMEKGIVCGKARNFRVKHIECLWLLLSHLQAKILASFRQNPFDKVDVRYCDELSEELQEELRQSLNGVNLEIFLPMLFECILFQLTVRQKTNDTETLDNTNFRLDDALSAYVSSKESDVNIPSNSWTLPDDLLVKHCTATWRQVYALSGQQQRTQ